MCLPEALLAHRGRACDKHLWENHNSSPGTGMPKSIVRQRPAAKRPARKSATRGGGKHRGIGRPAAGQQTVGREALITRTCEMLMQLPPNKITRAEVARHMNVDPSLIRYYFRDRATLLLAAVARLTAELSRLMEEELARSDLTPESRLRARVTALLKLNVTYPFFHRLMIDELVNLDAPAAVRFVEQLTREGVAGYAEIIDAGVKDGVFRRTNVPFLFLAVIGMCEFFVNGMPILRIVMGKDFDQRAISLRYREFICDMILNGLKAK
jgi:TetR/AcrR family transcriptional regulator